MALVLSAVVMGAGCDAREAGVPGLTLEPVARIGSVDAVGAALSSVQAIEPTDSLILVLESRPARVAVFDHDGRWIRDIGRPGEGPGELRAPTHLGVTGTHLWVGDPFGRRVEVFTLDGVPAESYRWSVPADSFGEPAMPTAMLADGSVLAAPRRMILGSTKHRSYYSTTREGEPVARLYREVVSPTDVFSGMLAGGGFIEGVHPLEESPLVRAIPDGSGLVVVERPQADTRQSGTFRVMVIGPDGSVHRDLSVPYTPIPAHDWLDGFLARYAERMMSDGGSVDRDRLDVLREEMAERRYYPPVTAVVPGTDGSIWLRREEVIAADSVRWQVLGRRGGIEGALMVPAPLEIVRVSRNQVWAVELDELDVPFVVRFRVEGR